jgi:transcriptional regulator with GAF, ATPase, and Fis domain
MLGETQSQSGIGLLMNVFPIIIPPMRERSSDIIALADYFVEHYSAGAGKNIKRISTPALNAIPDALFLNFS